jgi:DNA-binding response OmpR family regulator/GGDEF domain-containing protein
VSAEFGADHVAVSIDPDANGGRSALHVMAIVADPATLSLMQRTLSSAGDSISVASDLSEGLARTAAEAPDLVFVDVELGQNAGLAVVHHVRAIAPAVAIYALARPEALELAGQAVALGGSGMLLLPLSGDELLTAVAEVRTRKAEREDRARLEREAAVSRRGASLMQRIAEVAEARSRREGAERLAQALLVGASARRVLVYLPAGEGSRQLMRAAAVGEPLEAPSFCDDMELLGFASQYELEVMRLTLRREHCGLILLGGLPARGPGEDMLPLINIVTVQAATALALIGEREQSNRGAMKDPSSSAYTFAYFVDVAGREIDKARRYGRRFALATLGIGDGPESSKNRDGREPSVEAAERVLGVVRDTDVLARVDESEFYLLLPETGGMGAHTCRRRVMRQLAGPGGLRRGDGRILEVAMGVATFPHDGGDLSQLLRVAKHRADVSRRSVVRRLALDRLPLSELVDTLFWSLIEGDKERESSIEMPRALELPTMDVVGLAVGTVNEALRGGGARVVATQRSGMSVGAAVRSALGRDRSDVRFDAVDVSDTPGCEDLEVMVIIAEHGTYSLVGRSERGVVRGLHLADPLFADLVIQRLGDAAGVRLFD